MNSVRPHFPDPAAARLDVCRPARLLYVCHEGWPTFRPDVSVLFGKYLPRYGVASDLVTERGAGSGQQAPGWHGGALLLCDVPRNRALQYVVKSWHNLRLLLQCRHARYDAIQVRDMPVSALAGLLAARMAGLPFFYWMSFPQSEGQVARARARGPRAGMRYWFPLVQGKIGALLLYRVVLPRTDHVFVQSDHMLRDLAARGIRKSRMTAVPMGVDTEVAAPSLVPASQDARLLGKRVVVYLGTLDPAREIEHLLSMTALALRTEPNLLLVLAGDTEDREYAAKLRAQAETLGIGGALLWTGWLPSGQAWAYVRAAEIGLSPIPRGFLFDCSSPTKAIEYMALGLPVVVNDNPDQVELVRRAGAGLCVTLEPEHLAQAVLALLGNPAQSERMALAGRAYVREHRSYDALARKVAHAYRRAIRRHGQAGR